ncbi:MAG: nucleoside-diphosphate kinase [Candidatus Altiarchaeota archaeon]|nr:nucleoside-diphosphate kinase [Candidatus Altiarchaeota archaeon]
MRTLVIVKPDGVRRGLVGECIKRFERYGIRIAGLKVLDAGRERAERLYAVHKGKPFYEDLITYITSSPIAVIILDMGMEPAAAIKLVRKIAGATNPLEAEMGSIRGDYGLMISENIVHASDSGESADYEIPIFFDETEIVNYQNGNSL